MNITKTDIIGKWENISNTLVMLSDGRFTIDSIPPWYLIAIPFIGAFLFENYSGKWDLVDGLITLQAEEDVLRVWTIYSYSPNELTIMNENNRKIRFKRKSVSSN